MERYLVKTVRADLAKKPVFLVGPRQVGKTTLAKALMADYPRAQYLNWDVPADGRIISGQTWSPRAKLVVPDEVHRMRGWKAFIKGARDGRAEGQALLIAGSARRDTFRRSGDHLHAGGVNVRAVPAAGPAPIPFDELIEVSRVAIELAESAESAQG
jgi:predicted AAA+ superfamily ATPase